MRDALRLVRVLAVCLIPALLVASDAVGWSPESTGPKGEVVALLESSLVAVVESSFGPDVAAAPVFGFQCTGVLLAPGLVATAAHCVQDRDHLVVLHGSTDLCETNGWQPYGVRVADQVLATDTATLAVVGTAIPTETNHRIAQDTADTGTLFSRGWQKHERSGAVRRDPEWVELAQCLPDRELIGCVVSAGHACSGLSGAPVFDYEGVLVGIMSKSFQCADGLAWFGPLAG